MTYSKLFSAESVTEGHPDKICDQISDAILDEILSHDPNARVAVETVITTGLVNIIGEITTESYIEIPAIVRKVIKEIGYNSSEMGFDANSCGISVSIDQQSPDIAAGINESYEYRNGDLAPDSKLGAGDQGIMFGYACNETIDLMPLAPWLANKLAKRLSEVRKNGLLDFLRPDGKTQVTVLYNKENVVAIDNIVISTQHSADVSYQILEESIKKYVIDEILSELKKYQNTKNIDISNYKTLINPAGSFIIGGPLGDAGLTGRKIIVDTYGGASRHGGGAFSGKDPSKVDRSAAYALRWIAKNIVAANLADKVELQVAYAIGKAKPVSLYIDTFGTSNYKDEVILKAVEGVFDLRPSAIISQLDLLKPRYKKTSAYGHFGRNDDNFTWEKVNKVSSLIEMVAKINAKQT